VGITVTFTAAGFGVFEPAQKTPCGGEIPFADEY
jgi:hypothetical protein